VDPGKKNLVTMTDSSGISLRYTCRQRRFEGKLDRYHEVLALEKSKADGVLRAERDLSEHPRKTNDHNEFLSYLKEKKLHDEWTAPFYSQTKWKFRLYCARHWKISTGKTALSTTETGPEKTRLRAVPLPLGSG
jgi:hypothetical protein